jgi:hypothetical protein
VRLLPKGLPASARRTGKAAQGTITQAPAACIGMGPSARSRRMGCIAIPSRARLRSVSKSIQASCVRSKRHLPGVFDRFVDLTQQSVESQEVPGHDDRIAPACATRVTQPDRHFASTTAPRMQASMPGALVIKSPFD